MASSKDIVPSREDKLAAARAGEQGVLMREVDEAVRQDDLRSFMQRYGVLVGALAVAGLVALGGGLWWQQHREGQIEQRSEKLITAYDALGGSRMAEAKTDLAPLAAQEGSAAAASAKLALAAVAVRENRAADANAQYQALAADTSAPQPYRDLATLRLVTAQFDTLKPADVIARLGPLAKPGSAWFGSAGELVAMAYLKDGRTSDAGPLLAAIARDETVPTTIRSRTRQLAGLLGYDAVVDVSKTLSDLRSEQGGPALAPAQ